MDQEIEQIILRNLSGEASCEDIITFSDWLASSARNKENFLKIKNIGMRRLPVQSFKIRKLLIINY